MRTSYKAGGVLAVCAAGAAAATALDGGGFFAGMVRHGFLAATVGGLADWFAVTAIFRKPLGISYRTEILRRNRPRIMQALTNFISEDLLSKEHIMELIHRQDFAEMFASYLTERGGRDRIWAIVRAFVVQAANDMDAKEFIKPLDPIARGAIASLETRSFLSEGLRAIRHEALWERVASSLVPVLREMLVDPSVQADLLARIRAVRTSYVDDSMRRAAMFEMANLTDEKLLEYVNGEIAAWLDDLAYGNGAAHQGMVQAAGELVSSLSKREELFALADKKIREKACAMDFAARAGERADAFVRDNVAVVLEALRDFMEAWIGRFLTERPLRDKLNRAVCDIIERGLEKNHGLISKVIDEKLARLTDDEFIEMAQSRVADDLQMIRINGSLVGACVGMALFVLVRMAEGVLG